MNIGSRIRSIRKNKGFTQIEVAHKANIAVNSLRNYESNKRQPNMEQLRAIANALDISLSELIWLGDGPAKEPLHCICTPHEILVQKPPNIIPMPEMKKIPLIGSIACGAPVLAEDHIEEYIDIPKHIHADFALTCKGDSMINVRIFDGDMVYIHHQDTVENGEIAAVLIDGEATLKRVQLFEDHISLEPENPQYRPFVYWGEEMNNIRILGKAVAFTSMIR